MLVEFAEIVRRCFRKYDILARCGGDEFVLVLPNATRACPPSLIDRLARRLSDPRLMGRPGFCLSASVGVADSNVAGPEEVLKGADPAMYRHKNRSGGACQNARDRGLDSAVIVE